MASGEAMVGRVAEGSPLDPNDESWPDGVNGWGGGLLLHIDWRALTARSRQSCRVLQPWRVQGWSADGS